MRAEDNGCRCLDETTMPCFLHTGMEGTKKTLSEENHLTLARKQRALYRAIQTHVEQAEPECTLGWSCPAYQAWKAIGN